MLDCIGFHNSGKIKKYVLIFIFIVSAFCITVSNVCHAQCTQSWSINYSW